MQVQSLGQEDPLEKEVTLHSSTLAWEISWTEEPDGLHVITKVRHNLATEKQFLVGLAPICAKQIQICTVTGVLLLSTY